MKKSLRKLIPTFVMLVITAALLGTSTFAWFSMNNKVTVTGMEVRTKIGDSLQITGDTIVATAKKGDSDFTNGLNQSVVGILEPSSTIDATNYWYTYTNNVKADGDAIADNQYVKYGTEAALEGDDATNYDDAFSKNYGITKTLAGTLISGQTGAKPYVDYVFQLKAINTSDSPAALKLTKVNLLYNGAAASAGQIDAFRVAVMIEKFATSAFTNSFTLKSILRLSGATYFTDTKALSANAAPSESVSQIDTAAVLDNAVTAGATEYYKVVVRMWLEGEDTTCNNTNFLSLTQKWSLDLAIELGGATAAAGYITTTAAAVATDVSGKGTVTLDAAGKLGNGETPVSYQWKDASTGTDVADGTGATTYQYTPTADGTFYCVITTARGSVYRTNNVAVDVG